MSRGVFRDGCFCDAVSRITGDFDSDFSIAVGTNEFVHNFVVRFCGDKRVGIVTKAFQFIFVPIGD